MDNLKLAEVQRMLFEAGLSLADLHKEKWWGIRWSAIAVPAFLLNLYFVLFKWPSTEPHWWAAGMGAFNLLSALYLIRALYRFWSRWFRAKRSVQKLFEQLMKLQAYYQWTPPL